jgi:hypothetical protein
MREGFVLDLVLWVAPVFFGLVGLTFIITGIGRLFRGHFLGATGRAVSGALLLSVGAAAALLGLNIHTYNRLTYEKPVAEISFQQSAPQVFKAIVTEPGAMPMHYELLGDQWQMDARVLKWRPWANILGLNATYRLERLQGRYADVKDETSSARSVYALGTNPGIDLWGIANKYGQNIPLVDTVYGSGAYMPMADGATYEVAITQSGLIARAANEPARVAAENWK